MPDIATGVMGALSLGSTVLGLDAAEEQADAANRMADAQGRAALMAEKRANEMWDYSKRVFRPLEEQMVREASGAGSADEMEAAAGRSGADAASQFGIARGTLNRTMSRYGINPASGPWARRMADLASEEAIAKAGAMNLARERERALGFDKRVMAAGIGRGLPAASLSATAGVAGIYGDAARRMYEQSRQTAADTGYAVQSFQPVFDWIGRQAGQFFGGINTGGATFNPNVNYIPSAGIASGGGGGGIVQYGGGFTPSNYRVT